MPGALTSTQIRNLVENEPPLIASFINLEAQLQPSGIDLTLKEIARFTSSGKITCDNSLRRTSEFEVIDFDNNRQLHLTAGVYLVTYNEIVNLPLNLMGLALPRSSLLRSGVTINTAVWDPGYTGRAQSMLSVLNPNGFILEQNARIVQLVFLSLGEETESYQGTYQGENLH